VYEQYKIRYVQLQSAKNVVSMHLVASRITSYDKKHYANSGII